MTHDEPHRDEDIEAAVADIAEEFLRRIERGEDPDVEEYVRRYPKMAGVLGQVLPVLRIAGATDAVWDREGEAAAPDGRVDRVLGDFRILREIGRGGMGVVYEAEQRSLGRRVALKVLPFAAVMDHRQLQRFKMEAQAAAQLHHTNIVPVYSVGCERGVHYYAMQYVDGHSISTVIRELRRLSGLEGADTGSAEGPVSHLANDLTSGRFAAGTAPGTNLPATQAQPGTGTVSSTLGAVASSGSTQSPAYVQSVARLGVQAAEGLRHAHDMAIVHRDIKPSNLLLDARGHLWITDFGLAQYRTESGATLTMPGDILGTMRYMSPEQAAGRSSLLDHRTDIYSLGATLYELLALRPAFPARERHQLLRGIEAEEPGALHRLNPAVPVDLETIIRKAMAKDPAGRYASCRELADDLHCFLDHRPIKAKRPSLVERAVKWSHRHRSLVVTALLFMVVALATLSVSTALIWREKARTEAALDQTEVLRMRAQSNYENARNAVDEMTRVVERQLAGPTAVGQTRAELLLKAQRYYEGFVEANSKDPEVLEETARSCRRVADIHMKLGQYDEAEQTLQNAIDLFGRLVSEPRDPNQSVLLADLYVALSDAHQKQGDLGRAESAYRSTIDVLQVVPDQSSVMPDARWKLAAAYRELGNLLPASGRSAEGLELYERAVTLERDLAEQFPEKLNYQTNFAIDLAQLGQKLAGAGRLAQATSAAQEAAQHFEQVHTTFPDRLGEQWEHVRARAIFAELLYQTGNVPEANQQIDEAKAFQQKLLAGRGDDPLLRWYLAWNQMVLFNALNGMGRPDEATEACRLAIELKRATVASVPEEPEYQRSLAADLQQLGVIWMDGGQLDRAEQALNEARDLCERLVENFVSRSDDQLTLARVYISLSDILRRTGRTAPAEDAFQRAWQLQETVASQSPDSPHWGWGVIGVSGRSSLRENYRLMGEMLAGFGDYGRAGAAFAGATDIGPNDVYCWHMRALTQCAAGDSEAHRSTCREMLARFGQTQSNYAASRIAWSCALTPDGLDDWSAVLSLTQRFVGGDIRSGNSIGAALWNLASKVFADGVSLCEIPWHTTAAGASLYREGRYEEARRVMSQSVARWGIGQPFTYDYSPAYAWCFLAMTCHQLGQEADARAYLDRAIGRTNRYVSEDAAWQKKATLHVLLGEARTLLDSEQ